MSEEELAENAFTGTASTNRSAKSTSLCNAANVDCPGNPQPEPRVALEEPRKPFWGLRFCQILISPFVYASCCIVQDKTIPTSFLPCMANFSMLTIMPRKKKLLETCLFGGSD